MKILIIHQYYLEKKEAGGSRFNQFARHWASAGYKVTIVAGTVNYLTGKKSEIYKSKWVIREMEDEKIQVLRSYVPSSYNKNFLTRFWSYLVFLLSSIWASLISGKQDIVIATSPPLFAGITGYIISRFKHIPLIFEVRDLWPKFAIDAGILKNRLFIKLALWLEKWIYRKANLINVLTPAYKEHLIREKGILENKIINIPNAADLELMKPSERNNWVRQKYDWQDKFVILYVGAHGVANDLWQIIDVAELLKNDPGILFVLVGDGMDKPKLKSEAQKRNLTNIQFIGPISKQKIADFINASDACTAILKSVFTTTYPNKVFDYMACAKPIILPIDGAARDLVVDRARAGIFVRPTDSRDFKGAVLELKNNPSKCEELGKNGYNFVKENFDRQKLANQYLEIMASLTSNK